MSDVSDTIQWLHSLHVPVVHMRVCIERTGQNLRSVLLSVFMDFIRDLSGILFLSVAIY